MTENNNIDRIFREAARNFSPATPKSALDRMEAALKKRRRRIIFWWTVVAVFVITTAVVTFLLLRPAVNKKNSLQTKPANTEVTQKQHGQKTAPSGAGKTNRKNGKNTTKGDSHTFDGQKEVSGKAEESQVEEKKTVTPAAGSAKSQQIVANAAAVGQAEQKTAATAIVKTTPQPEEKTTTEEKGTSAIPEKKEENIASVKPENIPEESAPAGEKQDSSDERQTEPIPADTTKTAEKTKAGDLVPEKKPVIPRGKKIKFLLSAGLGTGLGGGIAGFNENSLLSSSQATAEMNGNTPGFSVSPFLSFKVIFPKNIYLSFGVHGLRAVSTGSFDIMSPKLNYINIDNFGTTPAGHYSINDIEKVMQKLNFSCVDNLRQIDEIKTTVKLTVNTVSAGYYFEKGRWFAGFRGGLSLAFISDGDVEINTGSEMIDFGKLTELRNTAFGFRLGSDLLRFGSKKLYYGLSMDLDFMLNAVNSQSEYKYYLYGIFIVPKIGWRF